MLKWYKGVRFWLFICQVRICRSVRQSHLVKDWQSLHTQPSLPQVRGHFRGGKGKGQSYAKLCCSDPQLMWVKATPGPLCLLLEPHKPALRITTPYASPWWLPTRLCWVELDLRREFAPYNLAVSILVSGLWHSEHFARLGHWKISRFSIVSES